MCAIARRGSLGSCLFGRTDDPHITIGTNTNLVTNVSESGSQTTGFIKGSGDITYDVNGNNITNGAKGISYTRYNHLNLPDSIVIPTQGKISLRYDAHGRLLRKTIIPNSGSTTYKTYNDGIEYRGGAADTLDAIYHEEGRITKNSGIFDYEYYLKDYLGNTRVVFNDKNGDQVISNSEILQLNDYYPYGMPHEGAFPGSSSNSNQYKYNGKELSEDFGWNVYNYGARWYDSGIARWTSVDPMEEKRAWMSSYSYVQNNPVLRTDPDGEFDDYFNNRGEYLGTDNVGNKIRIVNEVSENSVKNTLDNINVQSTESISNLKSSNSDVTDIKGGLNDNVQSNIATHYYEKLGYSKDELKNGKFGNRSSDLATTGFEGGKLDIKLRAGSIGKNLRNSDDVINLIIHERGGHGADFLKGLEYDPQNSQNSWNWERKATRLQVQHSSWGGTSNVFKNIIYDSYGKEPYVLNKKDQLKYFPNQITK